MHENLKMLVFILDHHPIVSDMLSMLTLRVNPVAKIITAKTFRQLDGLMRKHDKPDFIFIEPQSTGFSGDFISNHIRQIAPSTKVIAITDVTPIENSKSHTEQEFQYVIDKTASTTEVMSRLESLIRPENIEPSLEATSTERLRISKRHRQLIQMLDKGLPNREIAKHLGISESTVKVHFSRLFKILNVRNRLQALHFAKTNGWLL